MTRLKQAGALIVGKTVTTEFAYFGPGRRATRTTPRTPRAVRRGVAAAIAAGLAEATLGTRGLDRVDRAPGLVLRRRRAQADLRSACRAPASSRSHRRSIMSGPFAQTVAGVERVAAVLIEMAP